MCTRATRDPLLRLFFDKYHVHLLATPRANADVGQVYVHEDGATMAPGNLAGLLLEFSLPAVLRNETIADVSGKHTNDVKFGAALNLLNGVMATIGAPDYLSEVRLSGDWKNSTEVRFGFSKATRDSLDVVDLGSALSTASLKHKHPLIREGRQYFVVTAVLRTTEITLQSKQKRSGDANLKLPPAAATNGSAAMSREGVLKVESETPLAFAVELHELEFSESENRMLIKTVRAPVSVRGKRASRNRQTFVPAEIGGDNMTALLDVAYTS